MTDLKSHLGHWDAGVRARGRHFVSFWSPSLLSARPPLHCLPRNFYPEFGASQVLGHPSSASPASLRCCPTQPTHSPCVAFFLALSQSVSQPASRQASQASYSTVARIQSCRFTVYRRTRRNLVSLKSIQYHSYRPTVPSSINHNQPPIIPLTSIPHHPSINLPSPSPSLFSFLSLLISSHHHNLVESERDIVYRIPSHSSPALPTTTTTTLARSLFPGFQTTSHTLSPPQPRNCNVPVVRLAYTTPH